MAPALTRRHVGCLQNIPPFLTAGLLFVTASPPLGSLIILGMAGYALVHAQ